MTLRSALTASIMNPSLHVLGHALQSTLHLFSAQVVDKRVLKVVLQSVRVFFVISFLGFAGQKVSISSRNDQNTTLHRDGT